MGSSPDFPGAMGGGSHLCPSLGSTACPLIQYHASDGKLHKGLASTVERAGFAVSGTSNSSVARHEKFIRFWSWRRRLSLSVIFRLLRQPYCA